MAHWDQDACHRVGLFDSPPCNEYMLEGKGAGQLHGIVAVAGREEIPNKVLIRAIRPRLRLFIPFECGDYCHIE